MPQRTIPNPARFKLAVTVAFVLLFGGCFAGYWASSTGSDEYAVGEEHEVNLPAQDTFVLTQDVLRGAGVLFDVTPDNQIVTFWNDADTPASMWGSLVGMRPRYRYEIRVISEGSRQSKIIANVRTEEIANNEIDQYKATRKLNLFDQFDRLAAGSPLRSMAPTSGGVNFALLPGEDLQAFAKRVTGNADNWRQIATDNGLKSPTDGAGPQGIWVRNSLVGQANKRQTSTAGTP